MTITEQIERCRRRAGEFLDRQAYRSDGHRFWRHSPSHDVESHPGLLLHGTWSGVYLSALLGKLSAISDADKSAIASGLRRFRLASGLFEIPTAAGATPIDAEYSAFHCTNYALGALRLLDRDQDEPLDFMEAYRTRESLQDWLARRDWSKPWAEGNNVVNLGSFYAYLAERGHGWAGERYDELLDWHDANQRESGFWHAGDVESRANLMNAFAGAAHNLHLYYHVGRDVPNAERVVDSCLRLGYLGIRSACIDIDMIDILANFRRYGHRTAEIDRILGRYLVELLQIQNADGGFSDNYVTNHVVYGFRTPPGESVMWTTWFRLVSIGMIACLYGLGDPAAWTFRDTLGMGYFHPEGAIRLNGIGVPSGRWLALQRRGRFARQRLTSRLRRALSGKGK